MAVAGVIAFAFMAIADVAVVSAVVNGVDVAAAVDNVVVVVATFVVVAFVAEFAAANGASDGVAVAIVA